MIPKQMNAYLRAHLPETTWQNRLVREEGMCFMEFRQADVDRLARLGIQIDSLGPRLVACLWDEESPLEVGGYLVVECTSRDEAVELAEHCPAAQWAPLEVRQLWRS